MNRPILDVLIVGAGPAGTTLAIDLTRRGHSVRVIDKGDRAFDGSRAKGLQPRTLEVLEDLGALEAVLDGGSTYPLAGIHLGPLTVPWRMMRRSRPTPEVPYPNTWLIPQSRTDRALHGCLEKLGGRVEFGTALIDFTQDSGHVTANVAGPAGAESVTARYLVGADGGSSLVRKRLGIDFTGSTREEDRIVIVDAVTQGLPRNRWHLWPRRGGQFTGACPLPDSDLFQWMVRLAPDEEPVLDEARLNERIRSATGDRRITLTDIRWTSVFRPNIRLAESYGTGRVLIAGDAAHVHPPAGAQGLNTGVQDAYNLGWKLAQVLSGADPALLDTYEAERMPIAAGVLGLSVSKYEGIARLDPSSIRRGKDEQQLALTYFGGPLAAVDGDRTETLRAGDRMPDAELRHANGERVRLFDLMRGPHFTAIANGRDSARALERLAWPDAGAPLRRLVIGAEGRLADPARTLNRVHGLGEDTLVLVRPDGYIGHIANDEHLTRIRTAIQPMTPTTRSRPMPATRPGADE
ncbi:FAD-dependent oxidoreductase [Glycomyces sp. NPDC049804]|uniref:FAD-dependent oxidoreductase n=1 Tax=Glycomyces sp. NPDC049804 TaxID=3154363 RepID=UPI0034244628